MASEGPIGIIEGTLLKFSDWITGKTISDRLDDAVWDYNFPMIEWCLQQGADLNKTNWGRLGAGETPFYWAIFYKYYLRENIERLIELGADVHAEHIAFSGKTLLHDAVRHPYNDLENPYNDPIFYILIEKGVDLDAMECGYTALWLAAQQGLTPVVERLIQAGADYNRRGTDKFDVIPHSPLEAALRAGHHEVVALLRGHGAIEHTASHVASSSSTTAITLHTSIAANRKKAPAKHARKETPVKEVVSKRARKR